MLFTIHRFTWLTFAIWPFDMLKLLTNKRLFWGACFSVKKIARFAHFSARFYFFTNVSMALYGQNGVFTKLIFLRKLVSVSLIW
jgi:hypothetical protein